MRLFIALNLPAGAKKDIHDATGPIRDAGLPVRWLDPESYHLTLKFLGTPRPALTPALERKIAGVGRKSRPFSMKIGGFGAFPTIRRPRVLWIRVEPVLALRCLKQDVEWELANLGFSRETSAFHPHITVARARRDVGAGAFRGLDGLAAGLDFRCSVDVTSLELMRSRLARGGAHYSVMSSAPLGVPDSR